MICAGRELLYRTSDVDSGHRAGRFVVADRFRVGKAELAYGAVAPAPNIFVFEQCARVVPTRGQVNGPTAYVDQRGRRRQFVVPDVVSMAETERAPFAAAPTRYLARGEQRAAMISTGNHLHRGTGNVNRCLAQGQLIVADGFGVTATELSVDAEAPAPDGAISEQRTRMFAASGHLCNGLAEVQWTGCCWQFVVSDIVGVTVAERTVEVAPPTACFPGVENGAAVHNTE